jgi:hypothetical protein
MTTIRAVLWALSVGVWVFSAGFDGAFLRRLMPDGVVWAVFAYGLNFVADVSNELLAYCFMKLQQDTRRGSKKWKWSYLLLVFEAGALYFGTVFSWATIASAAPDLAPWLQWSAALFAQSTLLGLGVAQALLDVQVKAERSEPKPAPPRFACDKCSYVATGQHALNAHQRVHSDDNGHHAQPERVGETRS